MSYIGNTQNNQNYVPAVDFFSGNGSTTAFTLSRQVASVAAVQAVISNVPQNPGSAFTVSGSTITFTSAPPSGTNNIYVYYTSPNTQVVQPGQGTVYPASLSTGGPNWDASGNLLSGGYGYFGGVVRSKSSSGGTLNLDSSTAGTTNGIGSYSSNGAAFADLYISANQQFFFVGGSERMRIDSSGTLLVGLTSNTYHTLSKSNSANYAAGVLNPNATNPYGLVIYLNGVTGGSGAGFLTCVDNANRLLIAGNGNVTNVNGSYGTISDIKLKENIVYASSKLDDVLSLKVRNFNFVETPDIKQIGFIAQEFETVFPSMIEESVDRDSEGNDLGTTTKSIKTSVLVPILVKAFQELNEKVEAQAAEIAALKGVA